MIHPTSSRPRRIAIALLASIAVIGPLAACSSDDASGGASESGPLEVWTRTDATAAETYDDMFAAFTEETGIEIDHQPVVEFDTQLQARAAQQDLPDLLINDAGSLGEYVSQGFLAPVDRESLAGQEDISDASWDQTLGTDGTTYGVPFSRQANIVIARKDWRETLGLALPTTWQELDDLADAFATGDPDGNGQADTYGMAVPGTAQNGYIARWGVPYIWQAGGELLEQDGEGYTSVVDSPETLEGLEFIRDQFCTPGHVVPGSINYATSDIRSFQEGAAGMYLTGPYNFNSFDDAVGRENVEVIPMPEGPEGTTTFAEGENIYYGSTRERTDDRAALTEFLISAEGQEMGMDSPAAGGDGPFYSVVRLPVNTTLEAGEVYADDRWQVTADAYADASETFPWNINFIPFRQVLADGMNAMMADCESDLPALLEGIDAGFETELANQGLAR